MTGFFTEARDVVIGLFSLAGGLLLSLLGDWDILLTVLVCCMGVDYVTGMIVAAMGKSPKTEHGGISSSVGFKGILKKVIIMLMVLLAALVDRVIGTNAHTFRTMACLFYISNEGLSALENSALAGVPWPARMKHALELMKNKNMGK